MEGPRLPPSPMWDIKPFYLLTQETRDGDRRYDRKPTDLLGAFSAFFRGFTTHHGVRAPDFWPCGCPNEWKRMKDFLKRFVQIYKMDFNLGLDTVFAADRLTEGLSVERCYDDATEETYGVFDKDLRNFLRPFRVFFQILRRADLTDAQNRWVKLKDDEERLYTNQYLVEREEQDRDRSQFEDYQSGEEFLGVMLQEGSTNMSMLGLPTRNFDLYMCRIVENALHDGYLDRVIPNIMSAAFDWSTLTRNRKRALEDLPRLRKINLYATPRDTRRLFGTENGVILRKLLDNVAEEGKRTAAIRQAIQAHMQSAGIRSDLVVPLFNASLGTPPAAASLCKQGYFIDLTRDPTPEQRRALIAFKEAENGAQNRQTLRNALPPGIASVRDFPSVKAVRDEYKRLLFNWEREKAMLAAEDAASAARRTFDQPREGDEDTFLWDGNTMSNNQLADGVYDLESWKGLVRQFMMRCFQSNNGRMGEKLREIAGGLPAEVKTKETIKAFAIVLKGYLAAGSRGLPDGGVEAQRTMTSLCSDVGRLLNGDSDLDWAGGVQRRTRDLLRQPRECRFDGPPDAEHKGYCEYDKKEDVTNCCPEGLSTYPFLVRGLRGKALAQELGRLANLTPDKAREEWDPRRTAGAAAAAPAVSAEPAGEVARTGAGDITAAEAARRRRAASAMVAPPLTAEQLARVDPTAADMGEGVGAAAMLNRARVEAATRREAAAQLGSKRDRGSISKENVSQFRIRRLAPWTAEGAAAPQPQPPAPRRQRLDTALRRVDTPQAQAQRALRLARFGEK